MTVSTAIRIEPYTTAVCQHERRVIVHDFHETPVGFEDGEPIIFVEDDPFERCADCGVITKEHIATE